MLDIHFVVAAVGIPEVEVVDMKVDFVVVVAVEVVDRLGLQVVGVVVDPDNPFVAVAAVVIMLQRMHLNISLLSIFVKLHVP